MSTAKISRRYAVALFELIQEGVDVRPALLEAAAFASDAEAEAILGSAAYPSTMKLNMLNQAISGPGAKEISRLVNILCERNKVVLLPEIACLVDEMIAESESSVDAQVTTVVELTAAVEKTLAESLTSAIGKAVNIIASKDASILGGMVIRVGDRKIDCSVRGRLDGLKKAIVS